MAFQGPYDELLDASKYDFVDEIKDDVWKVRRKEDQIEYLAHDITELMVSDGNPTDLHQLLTSEKTKIIEPLKAILNHWNIVSLKDIISVQTPDESQVDRLYYAIWEFCDAGNLGNLFFGVQRRSPRESNLFLPESLCWHVLLSVTRALAWLHEGARPAERGPSGNPNYSPEVDWEPILHRNIHPENIFFMHPKRGEWYGNCKLGNFLNAFISGHHNGYEKRPQNIRVRSEALAPSRTEKFQPLEDLIKLDEGMGHIYPQQEHQPYTRISELRAVGELLQAMMVRPSDPATHFESINQRSAYDNLQDLEYSHILKNMVIWLMEFNPDEVDSDGYYKFDERSRNYTTTGTCVKVETEFQEWLRSGDPEASKMTTTESELKKQRVEDKAELAENLRYLGDVYKVLDKQDKLAVQFYGKPKKEEDVEIVPHYGDPSASKIP
ncbi:hypothetical protein F5Y02DRAFT_178489 [Annulohypoxylon stygium]|nr:hypothetical protein F5Y02DRAFT_178489 [Annulohypoxylon stygium]